MKSPGFKLGANSTVTDTAFRKGSHHRVVEKESYFTRRKI